MTDRYSALVEHYDLPSLITIIKNVEYQETEHTGEYINRIGEEFRTQGHMFTNHQIAETLKSLLEEGYVDDSPICKRLLQDEPQPFEPPS